jgi:iron complex transport system ATP-binding protein
MATLAGALAPLAGRVVLDGRPVHVLSAVERAQRVSIVTTERVTGGELTGRALVALGRTPYTGRFGRLRREDHRAVDDALADAGAGPFAERLVDELSDGERQKVMLARALAQDTPLLVLDEITAFLDLPRRVEMMRTLRRLTRERGKSVLLSTHDLDLALRTADRIWLLAPGTSDAPAAVRDGAPEDLVLGGEFEAAFRGEGVAFDGATGTFRVSEPHGARVVLDARRAPPAVGFWTAHALERSGYTVVGADALDAGGEVAGVVARVTARGAADGPRWHVATRAAAAECASLREVVGTLGALM